MSIYKSQKGREESLLLYDKQLLKLGKSFLDIYVETSFGKTHIVETGNKKGIPLLVFHGGNSTTAYNLLMCRFLLEDFHIYAVDTIGHPGKSDEVCLSHRGYDYGKWASEVIDQLGYDKIACFGISFGGGVLAKLTCVAPEKVKKSVLIVPAGISNALPISSVKMMIPLLQYRMTKKKKYVYTQTEIHFDCFQSSDDVLNECIHEEHKRWLYKNIYQLPKIEREVILLSVQDDLSDVEISQILNISVNYMRVIRHRVKEKLRKLCIEEGYL